MSAGSGPVVAGLLERARLDCTSGRMVVAGVPDVPLGWVVKRLRERRDLTQGRLAAAAGVGALTVARVERCAAPVSSLSVVAGLADALGVSRVEFAALALRDWELGRGGWEHVK
ncbi:helix-turn-helix domain-containing protein [Amycolatopsis sp. NPDC059021]|uniref:helix-turn-helix domain-containing protein n=1 Tax=Amycolatopsis sp. NPDC059021 TaxID=3346704 RepID=UPI00366EB5CF